MSGHRNIFRVPTSVFSLLEGGKNPVPSGEGFRFLPPLPSSKNSWHLVSGNFRKSILCLKIAKNTFCKKCLYLPSSHTL